MGEKKKEEKIQRKIKQNEEIKNRRKSSPAKFFSFRKQSTDTSTASKSLLLADSKKRSDSTYELTNEILTSWTIPNNGFENMINHKKGRELFGQFLEKEFSAENLRFWVACQELDLVKNNKDLRAKCEEIFVTYLDVASPQEVSLD